MKLVYNVEIPESSKNRTAKHEKFLKDFIKSGESKAELIWQEDFKSADSCAGTFRTIARRKQYKVLVLVRGNRVFFRSEDENGD